ncbi:MAG TPA: ABC transporter ATP-binding protein, partial [Acidobacteria bacterium]|nr:ABC transporter ATP-binding protein [Acidobacteriota bacterium]
EPAPAKAAPKRLGYLEQREWDQMEDKVLAAEDALARAQEAMDDPGVASNPKALQERLAALTVAQAEVERLYARWAELEEKVR